LAGRSLALNLFLAMNPHGPSAYYVALFSGWSNATAAGEYHFAAVSTEASYLEITGCLVSGWSGRHAPPMASGAGSTASLSRSDRGFITSITRKFNSMASQRPMGRPPHRKSAEVIPDHDSKIPTND